jgi:hypothetical protein
MMYGNRKIAAFTETFFLQNTELQHGGCVKMLFHFWFGGINR